MRSWLYCSNQPTLCNHGQCENTMGGYQCNCDPGYGQDDCSTWEGCASEPCENGGKCDQYSTWNRWTGTSSYSIRCSCPPAFRGAFCEKENYCLSNPCGNKGDCRDQDEDFECDCFPGFTGRRCESTKLCQSTEEGVEYEGSEIDIKWNVDSAELCAAECKFVAECKVWTFLRAVPACFLKSSWTGNYTSSESTSGECNFSMQEGGKIFCFSAFGINAANYCWLLVTKSIS